MQDLKVHYLKLIDNAAVFGLCHNSLYIVMTHFIKPPLFHICALLYPLKGFIAIPFI